MIRAWRAIAAGWLLAAASAAVAAEAGVVLPLERPAMQSPLAARGVLLALHRLAGGGGWIAAGERGHVLLSVDGNTWRQAAVPVSTTITAVAESPTGQLLAVGHGLVVLRSSDHGATWVKATDGRKLASAFAVAAARANEQGRSTAAGRLLRLAREGADKPLLDVTYTGASTAIAVGAYGVVLSSADAGATWSVATDALPSDEDVHLNAVRRIGSHLWIVGERGRVYRSSDNGVSFESVETPAKATLFTIAGAGEALLAAGLRGHAIASSDDGRSWRALRTDTENSFMAATVAGTPRRVVLADDRGGLWRLANDKASLAQIPLRGRYPIADLAVDNGRVTAAGLLGIEPLGALPQ